MPPIKNKKNVKFNVLNFSAVLTRGGATSRKYLNGRGRQHCQAEKIEAKEYIKKDMVRMFLGYLQDFKAHLPVLTPAKIFVTKYLKLKI